MNKCLTPERISWDPETDIHDIYLITDFDSSQTYSIDTLAFEGSNSLEIPMKSTLAGNIPQLYVYAGCIYYDEMYSSCENLFTLAYL